MLSNFSDHQSPQFRVLSDRQCEELYLAALECLNRIGVIVGHDGAVRALAAAGARVEGNHVYIPPHIIQETLTLAPKTFMLWTRDGTRSLQIAPDRVYFGPGPTCTYFYDPETRERRKARRGDAAMTARVCDALENIDFLMSLSMFDDVRPMLSPVYEYAEMISNSVKPVVAWATEPHTLEDIYQVAVAVAGSQVLLRKKPLFAYFANYESPLRHGEKQIANMIWAAEHGIPIAYIGGPTVGLESPMTGASGLVLHLAAALSGLAIIQLKRRGAAMAIGGMPAAMDLFTARPAYGSPEMFLNTAAAADLARYLRLPFVGTAGASESKVVDAQTGAEIAMQILMASLSGAGLVHDVGFLDCADIGSLELLVFADEVISMVKRVMRGITVNQQTIMLDLIEKVGPGGHFLAEKESVALTRQEIWVPKLLDRNPYMIWEEKGAQTTGQRTYDRLQHILKTHEAPPLPPDVAQKIKGILEAAELRAAKG